MGSIFHDDFFDGEKVTMHWDLDKRVASDVEGVHSSGHIVVDYSNN
jgi:hypothetical protein